MVDRETDFFGTFMIQFFSFFFIFLIISKIFSFFFKKIFAKYTPADPTTDEDPDNWNLDEIEKTELDVKEDVTASTEATDAAASSKDETKPE